MRLVFILIGVVLFSTFASALVLEDCESSMVAYFQFEGNRNDGLSHLENPVGNINGYPSFKVGMGVNFTSDDSLDTTPIMYTDPDPPGYLRVSPFTVEFWYKPELQPGDVRPEGDLFKSYFVDIELRNPDEIRATIRTSPNDRRVRVSSNFDDSVANHFAVVYDIGGGRFRLYINGVEKDSTSSTGTLSNGYDSNLYLGDSSSSFGGLIDEVAIYKSALSGAKISDHYSLSNGGTNYCESSSGEFSSATSEFLIAGCSGTDYKGVEVSVPKNSCSREGGNFCSWDEAFYNTLLDAKGCSFGADTYTPGDPMCCPTGYVCNQTSLTCDQVDIATCVGLDETTCAESGCYWIQEESACASSPSEFSCAVYKDAASCGQDNYNVGSTGVGTEICSSLNEFYQVGVDLYVVPQTSCECVWDSLDNQCKLSWNFTQALHGGNPNSYECHTSFAFGECQDGEQDIRWNASPVAVAGSDWTLLTVPGEATSRPGCMDGSVMRACGEPVVKLPGFSALSFILSISLLGIYYYARRRAFE